MSILSQKDVTTTNTPQTVTTTSELGVQTSNTVPLEFGSAKVSIRGLINLLVGTGTTSLTMKLYRSAAGVTQTLLQSITFTVTAGNTVTVEGEITDSVIGFGTVQYVMSITQNAATGNGTVNLCSLAVEVLSG